MSPARVESGVRRQSGVERPFQTLQQGRSLEWFSQQTNRSARGRPRLQVRLRTRGDHDDRHSGVEGGEQPLEIKTAHAGHVDIGDDTVAHDVSVRRDKFFRRREAPRFVSQRKERFNKRGAEWIVIVDDSDQVLS
jgi:hypothetical protein